ncbi:MAG: adenylate/guanylate cyclase domain-containing protein [Deltaproteobacteria bacterium]|nr:adenylate/guanylate cyclase domain-containing protein [Deltaproteobacteria bacterium]
MRLLKQPAWVAALLVALWALASGLRPAPLESLERWSYDLRTRLRGPQPSRGEVVVVGLDDATSARDPELFTRRAGLARLIEALRGAGASVIGLDLFLAEPEALLGPELAAEIEALLREEPPPGSPEGEALPSWQLLRKISELLAGDRILAETLSRRRDVVLALHLGNRGGPEVDGRALRRGTYGQFAPGTEPYRNTPRALASLPLFAREAAALGTINLQEDPDKIVRTLPVVSFHQDRPFAPLSLQVLARHAGYGRGGLAYTGGPPTIAWGEGGELILEPGLRALLNLRGRQAFPFHSAVDVVEGKLPEGALQGKMVLVGVTYLGHDALHTPLDEVLPGVFLHAEAIDNFLAGDFHRRSAPLTDALLTLLLGLGVVLLFLPAWSFGPGWRIGGALLLAAGHALALWLLFRHQGLWLAAVGPGLALVSALGAGLLLGWLQEGQQRRQLRHTFAHYLSPAVIEQLIRDPAALAPGGARQELTVLFSDIRSFTTLSEKHSPEEVVAFLGRYLDPMTGAVLGEGGLLDKYIGDAIMAVFGAPVHSPDHPAMALRAALAMHAALEEVRAAEEGAFADLAIGIGLNTGEMVVGNMGSRARFDYTVVGDAVNLAARLEGLTKNYGVFCLCGEQTRAAAPGGFAFREVDRVRVKGKEEPVSIHELLAGPDRQIASYAGLERFEAALAAWREGRFPAAREAFTAFAADNPGDAVAALYLERLASLGDEAPEGWDGVFTFLVK